MEKEPIKEQKNNKLSLFQRRTKSVDTTSTKSPFLVATYNQNDEKALFIAVTPISTTHSDSSLINSCKSKTYSHNKAVDTTSTKLKENKLKASSLDIFSNLTKTSPRNKLTDAVKNYDLNTLQQLVADPNTNLNQTDQFDNTALHYAIAQLERIIVLEKMITLFLHDPRIDTSIVRKGDNRTASQMLSGGEDPEMRKLLFARIVLDMQTNHEIGKMLLANYIYGTPLNKKLIKQTVQSIKNKIHITETKQQEDERTLPEEAKLPDYATDDFIFTMIENRIPIESINISESEQKILKEVFFQEIILFGESLTRDQNSVQKSVNNIYNTINASYNYLLKFTTKPCIFELFKTYIDQ
jgi:hypothetical protein